MNLFYREGFWGLLTKTIDSRKLYFFMRCGCLLIFSSLLTVNLLVAGTGNAQQIEKTTARIGLKGEPLKTALKRIERQTPFRFAYVDAQLAPYDKLFMPYELRSVSNTLALLLADTRLRYEVKGNTVVILETDKDRGTAAPVQNERKGLVEAESADRIPVKGKVTDEKGIPLSNVTVMVKGAGTGVSTNDDGDFSLTVADESSVLIISYIGFQTQEVTVGKNRVLEIRLTTNQGRMNEVVVTALGVRREKRNLTFSSQEIKGEELTTAKEPNLVNAMAGKVSGVQVTSSSGTPGASSRIVIRGATSPTGDNQPLFVVDGIPINNDETSNIAGGAAGAGSNRLVDIDPSIIESMNVLKGAAATALYGSAGARGVVIITTKGGAINKKPVLSLTSDLSFEHPILPKRQWKYGQGSQGVFADGETQKTSLSWGPLMDTLRINGQPAPRYNPYDIFFRTGVTTNSTVSVSGGGANSGYYMAYSYLDQNGTVKKNEFKRNSLFFKYNTRIVKNLNTVFQIGYSNSNQNRLPEGASNGPLFTLLYEPVSWNPYPVLNPDGSQRLYRYSRNPPLWDLDNVNNSSVVNRFIPVLTLNFTPLNGLSVMERVGADIYTEQDKYTESPSPAIGLQGKILNQNINFRQFNHDLIINMSKQVGDFNFNLVLGNNIYTNYVQNLNLSSLGLTINNYYNVAAGSNPSLSEAHYLQRKVGFYSQANIEYRKYLVLSLTGRYDGSSVLATDKNFYPYGSAAASFIFSELLPESLRNTVNFGKLRLSYATVGNDAVGPYSLSTPYVLAQRNGNNYPFQGQPGFQLSQTLGNPNLQNERLGEYEGGLEMSFLKDRLSFEGSYFYRKSKNGIIPQVGISNATGYSSTTVNTASIENKGIELLINATPVRSKDFGWTVTANFTRLRNKVLALYPGTHQLGRLIEGKPYNIFFGNRYQRNAQGQLLIDATGLPVVDADQGIVGDVNPDWLLGLTNSLRFKNLTLSFLFDMKQGGDVQNDVEAGGFYYGIAKVTENRAPLVIKGISVVDNKPNTVAVNAQTYYQTRQYESSIQNGTYIKLRNISLTYEFKTAMLSKTPFKSASLSAIGRNLWIYSPHFTGGDPEVSSYGSANGNQGIYAYSTPTSRSVNFTLKLNF